MIFCGITEIGLRNSNQDAFIMGEAVVSNTDTALVGPRSLADCGPSFFAVADGLGGHLDGAAASSLVVSALGQVSTFPPSPEGPWLANLIQGIHKDMVVKGGNGLFAMGSTVSGVLLYPQKGLVFNSGDSRVYRVRDGQLVQLTTDHNQRAVTGLPSMRNVLTNCLGAGMIHPAVDIIPIELEKGDLFFLATDGLYEDLGVHDWDMIKNSPLPLDELARSLVQSALDRGSSDNLTAVLVKIT